MVVLVSVSTFGVEAQQFANEVERSIDHKFRVKPIKWQLSGLSQKLLDLLDTRDGKKVIVNVANQLINHLEDAQLDKVPLIIISQLAGSRIVEEALSMIEGLDELIIPIRHIMLAPSITGTEWKSIGKYAGAAALIGMSGLALSHGKKKGIVTALIGVLGSKYLANKSTIADRLEKDNAVEQHNYANIERFVFYNPENQKFDGISDSLINTKFYKGIYPVVDLVSLQDQHLNQAYYYSSWFRKKEKTKIDLINQIIYAS